MGGGGGGRWTGGNMAALLELLDADFPKCQVTSMPRKHFNEAKGLETVNRLKVPECSSLHKDIHEKSPAYIHFNTYTTFWYLT